MSDVEVKGSSIPILEVADPRGKVCCDDRFSQIAEVRNAGRGVSDLDAAACFRGKDTGIQQSLVSIYDGASGDVEQFGQEARRRQTATAGQRPTADGGGELPLNLLPQRRRC